MPSCDKLRSQVLLKELNNNRYNHRSTQLAKEFLDKFLDTLEQYNDMHESTGASLSQAQSLHLLQAAVEDTPQLHAVKSQDNTRVLHGLPPMDFPQYTAMLENECTIIDQRKIKQSSSRRVNEHLLLESETTVSTPPSVDTQDTETEDADNFTLAIYEAARNEKARIPDTAWRNLSSTAKSAWTKVPISEREAILQVLSSPKSRSVNLMDTNPTDDEPSYHVHEHSTQSDHTSSPSPAPSSTRAVQFNDTHPGDPRRMMSQPGKKSGKPTPKRSTTPRTANETQLEVSNVEWGDSNHREVHSASRTLDIDYIDPRQPPPIVSSRPVPLNHREALHTHRVALSSRPPSHSLAHSSGGDMVDFDSDDETPRRQNNVSQRQCDGQAHDVHTDMLHGHDTDLWESRAQQPIDSLTGFRQAQTHLQEERSDTDSYSSYESDDYEFGGNGYGSDDTDFL